MTHYDLAMRLVGEVHERPGAAADPFILWCHEATTLAATSDEVAWCSSFVNRLAWLLRLPRSKSAAARSWLAVGRTVHLMEAQPGDIVVLERGAPPSGHVGIFAGISANKVRIIGGNQSDGVTVAEFDADRVIGVRRLT